MSMAPWVSSPHSENAMFEAVIISCMTIPTSHGNPPPPYDSGNGTAGQPASTQRRYALSNPCGVDTEPSALRRLCSTSPTRLSGANCSA